MGELTCFADRQFYKVNYVSKYLKEWWNCRDLDEYWRLWNLPVHHWFVRHMYNPLLKRGVSKTKAMLVIFFVSAVAHEYIVLYKILITLDWSIYWNLDILGFFGNDVIGTYNYVLDLVEKTCKNIS
jgi:diacylglycerol O-acyltransferase-1